MVYLVAGGWLADRILGSYRAVLRGGILIACGHYAMAAAIGMTAGLVQYVLGRRHPAGGKHSAEYALAPDAMRRAVRRIAGGGLALAALATLPAVIGRPASASTAPSRWRWAWP